MLKQSSEFVHHQLTSENHLLSEHSELVSLVFHPPDCCQDLQEGVLLQPGDV